MKNILGFILCGALLISCSDFDVEQFKAVYEEQCQESSSVSLDAIKEGATCNGVPLLFALIRADDYRINSDLHKIIRYLVNNRGFVLNKKSEKSLSLLQEALIHNKIKVAELIVSENTPFISKSNKNNNVLHTVLSHMNLRSSKLALEITQKFDGSLNESNLDGISPLEEAYQKGFGSIVFTLISRGVSEDYVLEKMLAGEMKPEVLFVREIEKATEFIRLAGPALDITYSLKDKSEYNLSHFASENNLENLLVQLINSKASFEHRSSIGTPIEIAAENGYMTIVEKLLSASHPSFGNEAINRALKGGHFDLASQLLDAGLKPGNYSYLVSLDFKKNRYSKSMKRYLVNGSILDRGYINSPAKRLIEEGRGAERIESTGNNVMFTYLLLPHFSESSYNSSNRKYLSNVAWKVWSNWNLVGDEFLVNKMDQSLLSYALHSYRSPGIKVLNYWNIISSSRLRKLWGQVDKLGMVPVHYAFMTKSGQPSKSEVKKMISYGADVNHINNMNESILHMICRFGNYKMAKYLIKGPFIGSRPRFDYKRLINLTNLKAESPLVLAKRSGNKSLISLLKAYGATK